MSLRLTRRAGSPYWWWTGTVEGQRIRESAGTESREVAERKCRARELELERQAIHGAPARIVGFDAAALAYLEHETRTAPTEARVVRLVEHFAPGTPCGDIDQVALDQAAAKLLKAGHKPATKLREIFAPARAVLTFAAWRGWCAPPQLRVKVKQVTRTEWLTPAQAEAMERAAPTYLRPLLVFLIATGARMGEAIRLEWSDVDLTHRTARLRDTKNGTDRIVTLVPRAAAAMAGIEGRLGKVFRNSTGGRYRDTRELDGGGQIREPWARVAAAAGLPGHWVEVRRIDRQNLSRRFRPAHTPHSARHTYATWHYAEHRDVLKLKAAGGWKDLKLVERYTHLAPATMLPSILDWRDHFGTIGTQAAHDAAKVA